LCAIAPQIEQFLREIFNIAGTREFSGVGESSGQQTTAKQPLLLSCWAFNLHTAGGDI